MHRSHWDPDGTSQRLDSRGLKTAKARHNSSRHYCHWSGAVGGLHVRGALTVCRRAKVVPVHALRGPVLAQGGIVPLHACARARAVSPPAQSLHKRLGRHCSDATKRFSKQPSRACCWTATDGLPLQVNQQTRVFLRTSNQGKRAERAPFAPGRLPPGLKCGACAELPPLPHMPSATGAAEASKPLLPWPSDWPGPVRSSPRCGRQGRA